MSGEARQAGRPADPEAARAVRSAVLHLVREKGYGKVSIAAIAAAAGVARQTLYNRWSSKADMVLDALLEETRQTASPPDSPGMPTPEQLERFLCGVFRHLERDGKVLRSLIAAAQEDDAFRDAFRERFVLPREEIVTGLLQRARQRGELDPSRDPAVLSAFVHGAFWYRLLNGQPVTATLAREIVAEVFSRKV